MPSKRTTVRAGGAPIQAFNSGLEVWLYDEANRETIRTPRGSDDPGAGGMPPDFEAKSGEGLVVGYSLLQDDEISVMVYVGEPFTDEELSVARWLEPQTAFLRLPSGVLCVEPNDCSRIGPEDPTDTGGSVKVPKGNYRLTLYRLDHEALDREKLQWQGAQELVLLTPGGNASDAASGLLPFEQRRDTSWVGKFTVQGKSAEALIWFGDYWDTFILNLDSAAIASLGLQPGSYIRTQVPTTGHMLVSAFAKSWQDAQRLPRPHGVNVNEYGFAALSPMAEWNGAEALFCRRDKTKAVVEDEHLNRWLQCTVEVLDAKPQEPRATKRGFTAADLSEKDYYEMSSDFLCLILSDVLPGVGDLDELPLSTALKRFDQDFGKLGLQPVGDVAWKEKGNGQELEFAARLYTGRDDCFAAIIGQEANIHIAYFTEKANGEWILTGLLDDFERAIREAESRRPKGAKTTVESLDEDLASMLEAHQATLEGAEIKKAPSARDGAEEALRRFLTTAFG